jgi:spore germination protein
VSSKITNRQIAFILLLTVTSYSIVDVSRAMATAAGYGSWVTILIATLFFVFVSIVVLNLQNKFEQQVIFDYSKKLVGTFGQIVVVGYYFIYFFIINIFLNLKLVTILKADFLSKTPMIATLIFGISVFCFIAYKGMTAVARLFEVMGIIYIVTASFVHILMITQGDIDNILPLFNKEDIGIYISALKEMVFPFLGIEVLLHIPLSKRNGKKSVITGALSIFVIGLFYLLVVESCIVKLGMNDIVHYNSSLIVAIRDTEVAFLGFLKRLDILFLTVGFSGFALGVTILFTIIIDISCKIFKKVKRSVISIIIAITTMMMCIALNDSEAYTKFVLEIGLYLGLVACLGIPLILTIIKKVKKNA